ncbi:MAG: helix-turn-helix transcriptional regulator [Clostridia bacterium]|nr:helix-turn-helix transcriptional regulator [Clostridia bacterium]
MYLMNLMSDKRMSRADLSVMSGVPDSTLRDILNGKAQIDHCEAATIYGIADALGTTVEDVLNHYWDECMGLDDEDGEREALHDGHTLLLFYSTVETLIQARKTEEDLLLASCFNSEPFIDQFYAKGFYREALFLLGFTDYLNRRLGLKTDPRFDAYRGFCLDCPVYSLSTLEEYDDPEELKNAKAYAEAYAIPELAAFNIFMTEEDISPDD